MRIVTRMAERAALRARERVAEALRGAVPGVRVEATRDGVAIEGRHLSQDARLRWIAGLIR